MAFEAAPERWILEQLEGAPGSGVPPGISEHLLDRWIRVHGVEGLVGSRSVEPSRRAALALQFDVAKRQLDEIGRAFAASDVASVVLKGIPLAVRLYDEPMMRPSVDFDLLVLPDRIGDAEAALCGLGYEVESGPRGIFFRERHHHVHVTAPGRMPVELHRLAYLGFGSELSAADLFEGRQASPVGGEAIFVPSPARELVYLAVHAAAHRFNRIGWLYDIKLLLEQDSTDAIIREAWDFAARTGFRGLFVAATLLLNAHFGLELPILAPARYVALARAANAIADEPRSSVLRMTTRIAYSFLLSDGLRARARFVGKTVADKVVFPTSE
jgi:Uncharacterised nucleotidyltransferase